MGCGPNWQNRAVLSYECTFLSIPFWTAVAINPPPLLREDAGGKSGMSEVL